MCIICNCPHERIDLPLSFLRSFEASRKAMKEAEADMLAVAEITTGEDRRRYDAIHKEMVRLRREWNKLEQKREHGL